MRQPLPMRFWVEVVLCIVSGALTALTMAWPDWIERIVGVGPDGGDGSAEWGLALALAGFTVVFIAMSGRTWWRHARLTRQQHSPR